MGSSKLHYNFKMFRIKYQNTYDAERIKEEVMDRMNKYLEKCDGRLINVKELKKCQELIFYFVTGENGYTDNWEDYLRNNLLKNYNILPNVV